MYSRGAKRDRPGSDCGPPLPRARHVRGFRRRRSGARGTDRAAPERQRRARTREWRQARRCGGATTSAC